MIVTYIQSESDAQSIADRIQHTHLLAQYNVFVWNGNPNEVPENKATPDRLQEIWGADKLFLDCTDYEAVNQYSLVGLQNGLPVIPIKGTTKAFDIPRTVNKYDPDNIEIILESFDDCIAKPDDFEKYDLSEFAFSIINI